MKIYTKTGDKGLTSLFDGSRVLKASSRIEALGAVDELNTQLGLLSSTFSKDSLIFPLPFEDFQNQLFEIGSALSCPAELPVLGISDQVKSMEATIDLLTGQMPKLTNFILPGGSLQAAHFHICRVTARRAERRVVRIRGEYDPNILIYLNRLSDFFFTLARYANYKEGIPDVTWRKR